MTAPRRPPITDDEQTAWARAARSGDAEAFGRLVLAHATELRRVLARYATPTDGADDLVQEAFVRAWENLDRFDPERPFGPWVRQIGIRLALDRRRARAVRPEGSVHHDADALDRVAIEPDVQPALEAEDVRRCIEDELASMPPQWADVLRLRAIEDQSYAEIAEILQIPRGTVMSRLARARARLALALARRFGAPHIATDEERA